MTGAAWFDPELAPNTVPLGRQRRDSYHTPTYDPDDAYKAIADALVKSDDVHELVQDVAEAHAFLRWAGDSGLVPQQFKNAAMLLRIQAKKLAGEADKWGTENAA